MEPWPLVLGTAEHSDRSRASSLGRWEPRPGASALTCTLPRPYLSQYLFPALTCPIPIIPCPDCTVPVPCLYLSFVPTLPISCLYLSLTLIVPVPCPYHTCLLPSPPLETPSQYWKRLHSWHRGPASLSSPLPMPGYVGFPWEQAAAQLHFCPPEGPEQLMPPPPTSLSSG